MAELLAMQRRRGVVEVQYNAARGRNYLELVAQFGDVPDGIGFRFLIEQRVRSNWCTFAGATKGQLRLLLETPNKDGTPRNGRLVWRVHEQLVSDADGQETTREYQVHGKTMYQFALCPVMRMTFESFAWQWEQEQIVITGPADLDYSIDIETGDREYPTQTIPKLPGKG